MIELGWMAAEPRRRRLDLYHPAAGDAAGRADLPLLHVLDGPDYLDRGRVEQDLLTGFAQGGRDRVLAGIDAPSGEGDLTGVGAHMLAAERQDQPGLRPVDDGGEDGGRHVGRGAQLREVPFERRLRRWR
jgi:hypothetical protein